MPRSFALLEGKVTLLPRVVTYLYIAGNTWRVHGSLVNFTDIYKFCTGPGIILGLSWAGSV